VDCLTELSLQNRGVFAVGYYAWGNVGDELLLIGLDRYLRKRGLEPKIFAFSVKPLYPPLLENVSYVSAMNPFSLFSALLNAGLAVFGGGTLFHDRTLRSIPFWTALVVICKCAGKRVLLVSQGFDVSKPPFRALAQSAVKMADEVSVRDIHDLRFANTLRLSLRTRIEYDLAFQLYSMFPEDQEDFPFHDRKTVGINLRYPSWWRGRVDDSDFIKRWSLSLDALVDRLGVDIVMVPFVLRGSPDSGLLLMRRIRASMNCRKSVRISIPPIDESLIPSLQTIFKTFGLFIGAAYHSLVVSTLVGVPFVVVPYQAKSAYLAETLDFSDMVLNPNGDLDLSRVLLAWEQREKLRSRLLESREAVIRGIQSGFSPHVDA
jgi:polysaccharide pyruvyl transferase WcaK-like protein